MNKTNKGITLVALVITIIVMLILAGITIATLAGENGILNNASKAGEETEIGKIKEKIALAISEKITNKAIEGKKPDLTREEIEEIITNNGATLVDNIIRIKGKEYPLEDFYQGNVTIEKDPIKKIQGKVLSRVQNTELKDEYGNKIMVPEGFKIVVNDTTSNASHVTEGIVIEDEEGNQFVWIPVGNIKTSTSDTTGINIKLSRYTFAEDGIPIAQDENVIDTYFQELETSSYGNTIAKDINAFKKSVVNHGGYYIGRYEASYGIDGKANSRVSTGYSDTIEPTTESTLWNSISQLDAAIASHNMYNSNNFTSDLINSYAWDTAILFIQNFSKHEAYSKQNSFNTSLANTGMNKDNLLNINDMASNVAEWTTESSSNTTKPSVLRGGSYYDNKLTSTSRNSRINTSKSYAIGFRPILY